jgi:hypothetical protein
MIRFFAVVALALSLGGCATLTAATIGGVLAAGAVTGVGGTHV